MKKEHLCHGNACTVSWRSDSPALTSITSWATSEEKGEAHGRWWSRSTSNAGDIRDARSIPGLGKSHGEGSGNSFQCCCLENPMERRACPPVRIGSGFSCPSSSPGAYSNSCSLSWWCHPTISSSVVPFSSCPHSFPASGSFPMCRLFASGGQRIGAPASASVLPMNIQGWSPLGWTGLISLQSKRLSRGFSSATVGKHQSHIHTYIHIIFHDGLSQNIVQSSLCCTVGPCFIFPWKKSYDQPRQYIKMQRHHFANKVLSSQSCGFSQ